MRLNGIVRMVLFGFLVPGMAARMSRQVPLSPAREAEQSSGSSQAKPQVELKRFSLLNGASINVSTDWIEREQMPLPPSPRLAPFAPQVTFLEAGAASPLTLKPAEGKLSANDLTQLRISPHESSGGRCHMLTALCLWLTGCVESAQESNIQGSTQLPATLKNTYFHGGN